MNHIRAAEPRDASRIAEIIVFAQRSNYRRIFQNDRVSFGVIQVLPMAQELLDHPELLNSIYVYDDEFVRGVVSVNGDLVEKLYVEPFFQGMQIGGKLLEFACREKHCRRLWVLEKNDAAIRFYRRHGFVCTGARKPVEDTPEYVLEMSRDN